MALGLNSLAPLLALMNLAQSADPPSFRAGVSLVHVDAQVLRHDGMVVSGLVQSDFRVFDQGVEQKVVAYAREQEPLDLVLLEDVSGSMINAVEDFAVAARSALSELRTGDRVAVMAFNTKGQLVAPFTGNLNEVKETVNRMPGARRGGTHIYDGIFDAAMLFINMGENSQRRRAVLVFTDNINGRGEHGFVATVESLWEADATLSGLITHRILRRGEIPLPKALIVSGKGIEPLVAKTGGEMLSAAKVESALPDILRRIRNRYSLYYQLPEVKTDAIRNIKVELTEDAKRRYPGSRVLARQGYRPPRDKSGFGQR